MNKLVFLSVFIMVLIYGCTQEENKDSDAIAITTLFDQKVAELKEADGSEKLNSEKVYLLSNIYGRDDPFDYSITSNFNETKSQSQDSGLSGIMWSPKNPIAIVNNKIVKVGDKTSLGNVIAIKKEIVIFEDETGLHEIRLGR